MKYPRGQRGFTLIEVLLSFAIILLCVGVLSKMSGQWMGVLARQEHLLAGAVCLDKQLLRLQTFGEALSAKSWDEYECFQYGKVLKVQTSIKSTGVEGLKEVVIEVKSSSGQQIVGVQKLLYGH